MRKDEDGGNPVLVPLKIFLRQIGSTETVVPVRLKRLFQKRVRLEKGVSKKRTLTRWK